MGRQGVGGEGPCGVKRGGRGREGGAGEGKVETGLRGRRFRRAERKK